MYSSVPENLRGQGVMQREGWHMLGGKGAGHVPFQPRILTVHRSMGWLGCNALPCVAQAPLSPPHPHSLDKLLLEHLGVVVKLDGGTHAHSLAAGPRPQGGGQQHIGPAGLAAGNGGGHSLGRRQS